MQKPDYKIDMMSENKKYCLITGGASGIGLEFSKLLINQYDLILASKNEKKLEKAKLEILTHSLRKNTNVATIAVDLSDIETPYTVFNFCKENNFDVEVLINNAGFGVFGELDTLDNHKMINMLNLNIISLTLLCKLFSAIMKEKRQGYILNVASLAAYQPVPYIAPYAASKSYVLNFTEAISKELVDYGVTVTCLSPGHTDTDFFDNADIGNKNKGFYGIQTRVSPKIVAKAGIDAMFAGKLSVIPGLKNNFLSIINRFCTRNMTATVSKMLTVNDWRESKK